MKQARFSLGLTLVEIIIVIGIISILASVALLGMSEYQKSARDKVREVDIEALSVTMRLYIEQYGADIDCQGGLKIDGSLSPVTLASVGCADAERILEFIEADFGFIPADPRGPGSTDYYYYYDNRHACSTVSSGWTGMLFAANLERKDSNVLSVCGVKTGTQGGFMSTTPYGGTISATEPYVKLVNYAR